MPETASQLRLFPAPQPLVDRLGAEFFRNLPSSPGVYRMADADGRLIYVGKAKDLRARLASYRRTNGQSRKTIRLIHTARTVTWEACETEAAALLLENELLRKHRPRFNRAGTWPTGWYVTLASEPARLAIRLHREPADGCFGAFRGTIRPALQALTQLAWLTLHGASDPAKLPYSLSPGREPREFHLEHEAAPAWAGPVATFLSGESDSLLQQLASPSDGLPAFERAFLEAQRTTIAEFYQHGPQRLRELRVRYRSEARWIEPAELDDLRVRHRHADSSAGSPRHHGSAKAT